MVDKPQESIGALWVKRSKKGAAYMTGIVNGMKVVCFAHQKKHDRQPDWRVFVDVPAPEHDPSAPEAVTAPDAEDLGW